MAQTVVKAVDTKWLALRALSRGTAPRYLAAAIVVLATARAWVGGFGWVDPAVVGFLVVVQPFVEWLIHVHVLHARPRSVAGLRLDPGRDHRAHHRNPHDLTILFCPLSSLVAGQLAFALAFTLTLGRLPLVLTGLTTVSALSLYYEWIHLLAHTAYRPRIAYFRNIWRAHRLHHYRNENYWFGITNTIADRVLRTFPDPKAVPTSPTAQNILGEVAGTD